MGFDRYIIAAVISTLAAFLSPDESRLAILGVGAAILALAIRGLKLSELHQSTLRIVVLAVGLGCVISSFRVAPPNAGVGIIRDMDDVIEVIERPTWAAPWTRMYPLITEGEQIFRFMIEVGGGTTGEVAVGEVEVKLEWEIPTELVILTALSPVGDPLAPDRQPKIAESLGKELSEAIQRGARGGLLEMVAERHLGSLLAPSRRVRSCEVRLVPLRQGRHRPTLAV